MKIRILSDIHQDINYKYPIDLNVNGENDVFTIVAGDVGGSPDEIIKWIKNNIKCGAFISGNHDVYDSNLPIEDIKTKLSIEFSPESDITYFDSDVGVISKEIADGILLVADVMYTDYQLPIKYINNGDPMSNMRLADPYYNRRGGMNDFIYGTCKKNYGDASNSKDKDIFRLVPKYYLEHHEKAFNEITKAIEENQDKQIILVTHHGLSPKCLDINYSHDDLDASYVSDKEKWILNHPNIKLIVSGHIHCRKTFMIGETRYAMNALGYCSRHLKQYSEETKQHEYWTPDCYVDTDDWSIKWMPSTNSQWHEEYEKSQNKSLGLLNAFIF